jgi:hypothetical protein
MRTKPDHPSKPKFRSHVSHWNLGVESTHGGWGLSVSLAYYSYIYVFQKVHIYAQWDEGRYVVVLPINYVNVDIVMLHEHDVGGCAS